MKSYAKRIRALRRLALAGCVVAVAAPTSASALPYEVASPADHVQQSQQQYTPPAGFHTEAQTGAPVTTQDHFVLRRSPDASRPTPVQASTPTPSVIRQIETVSGSDSGRTLAIVLASVALGIAVLSLGYAWLRMAQFQRRGFGIQ